MVLDMSDHEAAGAQIEGQLDHGREAVEVLALDDGVQRQRQAGGGGEAGEVELLRMAAAVAANAVGGASIGILDGELDVVQAGFGQRVEAGAVQQDAGGDEVGVEAGLAGGADEVEDVAARGGLAAGEVDLQAAELGCLGEEAGPGGGVQLLARAGERRGVGAIGAAMGELGQQGERRRDHAVTTPLAARSSSRVAMSARISSRGAA